MIDDGNKDLENIEEQFCARCDGSGVIHEPFYYMELPNGTVPRLCPDCSGLGVKNTRTKQTNNEDR